MEYERHFIVTTGRSGSTLLAAILAASGAEFGLPALKTWDERSGAMEHPDFSRATTLLEKARELSESRPEDPLRRLYWNLYRHEARRHLASALMRAKILKAVDADLALQTAVGLGYAPKVILNYRRPEAQIASQFVFGKYWSVDYLISRYIRVMRNALGAVRIFGGCVVSYEDLHEPTALDWAPALAEVTGLDAELLVRSRSELVRAVAEDKTTTYLSLEAERLWLEAEELRGTVLGALRPGRPLRNGSEKDSLKLIENLETNPVCSISLDPAVPCITVTWKGYATSVQLRYIHEQILHLIRQHGLVKILGDDTVVPLISSEDRKRITEDWFPRAVAAGLKAGASKKSIHEFKQASIDTIQSQVPLGMAIRSFDALDDARQWLQSLDV